MPAKGITDATVEEIKARVDLVDLISSYGIQVKTAGSSKKACCPFHHEKTPSFNINENKGFYHCFGCGESGDAIKFVQKMEGLTFVEAVKKLAEQCGVKIEEKEDPEAGKRKRIYALMAELAAFYHRCLEKAKEAEGAREYLKSRDLNEQVQEDFLIGYAPVGITNILKWAEKYGYSAEELEAAGVVKGPNRPGDKGYHRFGGRLMFSIRDKQGRVVAFSGRQLVASKNSGKYVNSPETVVFKKSKVLFGFDKAAGPIAKSNHHEAIICEGQIDVIRLHISGFPTAVASQGTAFTEDHVKMLKRVADQVTLVFDDDSAGHKATVRTAGLFLAAEMPVRVVSLPGGEDPDSFLRKHKKEAFQALLDEAESIMSFQVRTEKAKEAHPDSIDAMQRITRACLSTIAQAKSAVLKASMIAETARLLGLPAVALQEELEKSSSASSSSRESASEREVEIEPEEEVPEIGVEARTIVPPSKLELALCEFLLANEGSAEAKNIDALIGEYLPDKILKHEFVRKFVATWRLQIVNGGDVIAPWSETLPEAERKLFDECLFNQNRQQGTGKSTMEELKDQVCKLWAEYFVRLRGELSYKNPEDRDKLAWLTMNSKHITTDLKWSKVKELLSIWL